MRGMRKMRSREELLSILAECWNETNVDLGEAYNKIRDCDEALRVQVERLRCIADAALGGVDELGQDVLRLRGLLREADEQLNSSWASTRYEGFAHEIHDLRKRISAELKEKGDE